MSVWTASRIPGVPHPFASSIANEEWVIVSGMVGVRADGTLPESAEAQARVALQNVEALLLDAGSGLNEIVLLGVHVAERAYVLEIDGVIRELLPDPKPASPALTVVGLADPAFKVEFEVWAHRGASIVAAVVGTPGDPNL